MDITEPILIPEDLKAFVQSQIDAGYFRDAADYVRYLIGADQENRRFLEQYASDSRVGEPLLELFITHFAGKVEGEAVYFFLWRPQ